MSDYLQFIDAEKVNEIIKYIITIVFMVLGTSVGTFTRNLIFTEGTTLKQNVGFSLVSGFISFGIYLKFTPPLTVAYMFLICFFVGFFIPVFKSWLQGKRIVKMAVTVAKSTTDQTSAVLDVLDEELKKEEDA